MLRSRNSKSDSSRSKINKYRIRNVEIEVPREIITPIVHEALQGGWYESDEADELHHLIQEGEVILEIGAGLGFIGTLAARDPRTSQIHSYEANPHLIPVIRKTHELNGVDVNIHNEVLGDRGGFVDFNIHKDFWASSLGGTGGEAIQVKKVSFQDVLKKYCPSMMIIDIEGGEKDLFNGIDLTGVKKIMLELHQNFIGRSGIKHVFDTLSYNGFHYDQWHSRRSVVTFSHVDR